MLDPSILVGTSPTPAVGGSCAITAGQWQETVTQLALAESRAQILASVVELQAQLDQCRDLETAATQAARTLANVLSADRVQVAWKDQASDNCRVIGDSDSSATSARLADAAAEEVASRGAVSLLPFRDDTNRHSLLTLVQYAKSLGVESIVAAPIAGEDGEPKGAVIVIDPMNKDDVGGHANALQSPADVNHAITYLESVGPSLRRKLTQLQQMQPRRWERIVRSITDPATSQRRRLIGSILAVCCVIMLLPVHYNVSAVCELQPVERRFIDAPFDGPLDKVMVRPGDLVTKGQTLARINPREIEYQLAGLRADLKRAEQEKKAMVAEHDFAGRNIASLEAERIRLEAGLLEYQRDNLEIRSPLTGVVVTGDLEKVEGTPLSKGEPLFEIAPLGEMIVEVAIPESDFAYVNKGMTVSFYLHAMPDRTMDGTLERIHPAAELREHQNVFVAEVRVSDPDGLLRPGMRGRAWVRSGRRPLGWNLFHKSYHATCHALGW